MAYQVREPTRKALEMFVFKDDAGNSIDWTDGQLEIIDCIVCRSAPDGKKRVQLIASTQYGKSLAVAAGVLIRVVTMAEKWGIVAGTKEKARIIMEYIIMFALNNAIIKTQMVSDGPLERLKMKRSQDMISFKRKGSVRVFSADARRTGEVSKSLMGFGSPNLVEDESALIPDILQATVLRMLGGTKDNFLMKIGNPFNRNHFLRTWNSPRYYRVLIDYHRALKEKRYTADYIEEMREEPLFDILYGCEFPVEGLIDQKGWMQLLTESDIEKAQVEELDLIGERRTGNDVAGGGRNYSAVVIRGYNVAIKLLKKSIKDTMVFATKLMNLADDYEVKSRHIFIDANGIGRGCYDRVKMRKPNAIKVIGGEKANDFLRFENIRAEMYWRMREWILNGGKLQKDPDWSQLTEVKYKVDSRGRIKIMSKEEMLRMGIDSPDVADSLAMTFVSPEVRIIEEQEEQSLSDLSSSMHQQEQSSNYDPYPQA